MIAAMQDRPPPPSPSPLPKRPREVTQRIGIGRGAILAAIDDALTRARPARPVTLLLFTLVIALSIMAQAQDALIALGQSGSATAWVGFAVAVLWFTFNAWFWTRFILRFRFRAIELDEALPSPARRRRRAWIRLWLPRIYAVVALLGIAAALLLASTKVDPGMMAGRDNATGSGPLRIAAVSCVAVALAGSLITRLRRKQLRHERLRLRPSWRRLRDVLWVPMLPRETPARLGDVPPAAQIVLALTALIALAGLLAFGLAPIDTARIISAAPTILLAASGMMCGGTMLYFFGSRARVPLLIPLVIWTGLIGIARDGDVIPDNHDVRLIPGQVPERPNVDAAFARFFAAAQRVSPPDRPVPVVLVATAGGGIAAAFWTATILGDLVDEAPNLPDHIFAVSGVSGGALGASAFVAALRERDADGRVRCRDPEADAPLEGLRACLGAVLRADFLTPTLGSLLYPDLLQRFVPVVLFADRAAVLEASWERRWRQVFGSDRFARPFLDLYAQGTAWPALLLNGTSLRSGGRIVTTNLALGAPLMSGRETRRLAADLSDFHDLATADAALSTAADNSARFPYIGPAGSIRPPSPDPGRAEIADQIVDGGYFENFGATTLLDLLERLHEVAEQRALSVRFVVIQIISDPDLTGSSLGAVPLATSPGLELVPNEIAAPVETLLATRRARGLAATEALARRAFELGGVYVPLALAVAPTGAATPLSWSLSGPGREVIDAQWAPPCRTRVVRIIDGIPTLTRAPDGPLSADAVRSEIDRAWREHPCTGDGAVDR